MMVCLENLQRLEDFEVSRSYALGCRRKYLTRRLWDIEDELKEWVRRPWENGWTIAFLVYHAAGLLQERGEIEKEFRAIERLIDPDRITDEMIETARRYPVMNLVEFYRGKATAWCHDDRRPSLYHGTRNNIVVCPVCDKKFNPIDILIHRDGMSFTEAVKRLQ